MPHPTEKSAYALELQHSDHDASRERTVEEVAIGVPDGVGLDCSDFPALPGAVVKEAN